MFWDSTISFADGNPVPHGSYDELMARCPQDVP